MAHHSAKSINANCRTSVAKTIREALPAALQLGTCGAILEAAGEALHQDRKEGLSVGSSSSRGSIRGTSPWESDRGVTEHFLVQLLANLGGGDFNQLLSRLDMLTSSALVDPIFP
jgi:hypothetical protein